LIENEQQSLRPHVGQHVVERHGAFDGPGHCNDALMGCAGTHFAQHLGFRRRHWHARRPREFPYLLHAAVSATGIETD
jgi:hypothetical protein